MLTRFEPWSDLESPETTIVESLKSGERPTMTNDDGEELDWRELANAPGLVEVVDTCWAQEPTARPEFVEMAERLDKLEAEASDAEAAKDEAAARTEIEEVSCQTMVERPRAPLLLFEV